jgi:hypothetical protein
MRVITVTNQLTITGTEEITRKKKASKKAEKALIRAMYRPGMKTTTCGNCLHFKVNSCALMGAPVFSNFVCNSFTKIPEVKE